MGFCARLTVTTPRLQCRGCLLAYILRYLFEWCSLIKKHVQARGHVATCIKNTPFNQYRRKNAQTKVFLPSVLSNDTYERAYFHFSKPPSTIQPLPLPSSSQSCCGPNTPRGLAAYPSSIVLLKAERAARHRATERVAADLDSAGQDWAGCS